MGYEVKLIMGHRASYHGDVVNGRTEQYFETLAEIDLCKIGYHNPLSDLITKTNQVAQEMAARGHLFYIYDGSPEHVTEDKYGMPLRPVPASEVLEALKAAHKRDRYRRFQWAIALLKSMIETSSPTYPIEVIFFGH